MIMRLWSTSFFVIVSFINTQHFTCFAFVPISEKNAGIDILRTNNATPQIRRTNSGLSAVASRNKDAVIQKFSDWSKESGVKTGGIGVGTTSYGELGLIASKELSVSDIIAQVPSELVLDVISGSGGDASRDALELFANDKVYRNLSWWAQLSVRLNALDKGLIYGGLAKQPWLDVLPRKFNSPFHWSDDDLKGLQYDFMFNSVLDQRKKWKLIYSEVLSAANPEFGNQLTYEDFVWGCECARSRAFSGSYSGAAFNAGPYAFTLLLVTIYVGLGLGSLEQAANGAGLVLCANILKDFVLPKFFKLKKYIICPYIDMANHVGINEAGDVAFEYFGDSYSLTVKEPVGEGKEIMISYGSRSNDQLLQYYGFVEKNNAHDVYVMPPLREWDIDALETACGRSFGADRLVKVDRAGLLGNKRELNNDEDDEGSLSGDGIIITKAGGIDPAVLQALRALVSSETEWKNAGEAIGNFVERVSEENENLARLAARCQIKIELDAKPTTLEEDEKILKQMKSIKSMAGSVEEILSVQFRIEKKRLLINAISELQ